MTITWRIFKQIATYRLQPSLYPAIMRAVHSSTPWSPKDYKIDIVDDETWQVSTAGFAHVMKSPPANAHPPPNSDDPADIDDLRISGNLFYKLDRDSKEYQEYNFDFHSRKKVSKRYEDVSIRKPETVEKKIKGNPRNNVKMEESVIGKKQRVPTFNQLTGPYHEPFCLDIFISKASVRACIVHRATSNVVAVAHSISKDMKFDLGSTKNAVACAAVGKLLAQRALADDIHNVVYTPRKGEKLEGKLQCVLESVINNGVLVKVKLKQRNARKPVFQYAHHNSK